MAHIEGHDGRTIEIRRSAGSQVPYVVDWEDNVLPPPGRREWPSALLKQVRAYVSRRSWFADDDADVLAARLGCISKFQSLKSEDAVSWSWFGTLACADPEDRRRSVQWPYDHLGLEITASRAVRIDQWMRVLHPNAQHSKKGPELDARIKDPGKAVIYVEAKWSAALGTGKGKDENDSDDQVVLRRDSLEIDSSLPDEPGTLAVLGVSNESQDLTAYDGPRRQPRARDVTVHWLTWRELAQCDSHPLAAQFRLYLDWKLEHATPGQAGVASA